MTHQVLRVRMSSQDLEPVDMSGLASDRLPVHIILPATSWLGLCHQMKSSPSFDLTAIELFPVTLVQTHLRAGISKSLNITTLFHDSYWDREVQKATKELRKPGLAKALIKCYYKGYAVLGLFTLLEVSVTSVPRCRLSVVNPTPLQTILFCHVATGSPRRSRLFSSPSLHNRRSSKSSSRSSWGK